MKQYQVVLSKTAEKELSKMSVKVVGEIIPVLLELAKDPCPVGKRF